jgi:hypothetical protein
VVKIVTLTSSLTDTSEDGETTVSLGDVVDKLLNEDGLTDTGTAEETNLTTTGIGGKKVDNLNTGREHLSRGRLVLERWGLGVNRSELVGLHRSTLVNRLTNDVQNTAKGATADRDSNRSTSVNDRSTTNKTLGTIHGNSTDSVLTKVLGNLENEALTARLLDLESVQNGRKVILLELDILFVSINIVKTTLRARIKRQGPMPLAVKNLFNFKVSSIATPIHSRSRQTCDRSTRARKYTPSAVV